MIQPLLFFAFGFLSLALLVLLAAPGFRRSAERAARRRLEAGLPMSLNEIEAGKDALRAEHAVAAQRFEQEARTLRADRSEQAIAAGRAQEEARAARAQGETLRGTIAALEGERATLQADLAAAGTRAKDLEARLVAQEKLMGEARTEAGQLEKRFEEASFLASSRQIELVGRESDLERISEELAVERNKAGALEKDLNALRSAAETGREDAGKAAARTEVLQSELEAAREQAARSRADAEILRRDRDAADLGRQRLEADLVEERKERMELEVEFAGINRLLVSLFPSAAAGGDPAKALEAAAAERDRLEARAAALLRETKDLRAGLAFARPGEAGESPEAILREQMLDLAAQVTALAASIEGAGGPLEKALEGSGANTAAPGSSLADRIRALRET